MEHPKVLGSDGSKWQKIPKDHDLYYSFFDFEDGPTDGWGSRGERV